MKYFIIFAKNSLSAFRLNGKIEKTYYALVKGDVSDTGTINTPIYRPDPNKTLRAVSTTREDALPATTHWQVEKRNGDRALLKVNIETGRTHQIRVHFSHRGTPVAGDAVYGNPKKTYGLEGQCLHAAVLGFIHPITKEYLEFSSDLPDYFKDFLRRID